MNEIRKNPQILHVLCWQIQQDLMMMIGYGDLEEKEMGVSQVLAKAEERDDTVD